MKHHFIFCFIVLLYLGSSSCNEHSDNVSGETTVKDSSAETPQFVNHASIQHAELQRLLLNRFRCYVLRQSLLDGDELNTKDACCLCKTEQQEQTVSRTVQETTRLQVTIELQQSLEAMNAEKLNVPVTLKDTAVFYAFWTDSVFSLLPQLKKFRVRRDSLKTFESFQHTLERELAADYTALTDSAEARAVRIARDMQAEKKKDEPVMRTQTTESTVQSYWPLVAAVIACAFSLVAVIMTFDRKRDKRRKSAVHDAYSQQAADKIRSMTEEIKTLQSRIATIEQAQNAAVAKNKSQSDATELKTFSPSPDADIPDTVQTPPRRILFFSSPNSDGSFQNSSGRSEAVPGASIYRFELLNETTALFTAIDSPDAAHLALYTPENALRPACEYGNIPARAEQIETVQPGSATLEGITWKVTRKAKITFR